MAQQQLAHFGKVARRNAQATLRAERRTIAAKNVQRINITTAIGGRIHRARVRPLHGGVTGQIAIWAQQSDRLRTPSLAAPRAPIVAGIKPKRRQHQPRHQPVKPLARGAFQHRRDHGRIDIGIGKIASRWVGSIPRFWVGNDFGQLAIQRHDIIDRVAQPALVGQQGAHGYRHIGEGRIAHGPAKIKPDITVKIKHALLRQPHRPDCHHQF